VVEDRGQGTDDPLIVIVQEYNVAGGDVGRNQPGYDFVG
jgi:hypothetical protein